MKIIARIKSEYTTYGYDTSIINLRRVYNVRIPSSIWYLDNRYVFCKDSPIFCVKSNNFLKHNYNIENIIL